MPSTGFYEWSQDKAHQKYRFFLPGSEILYMAGLYSMYNDEERYIILTANGNDSIRDIHSRMPAVLPPEKLQDWLEDSNKATDILRGPFPSLYREAV